MPMETPTQGTGFALGSKRATKLSYRPPPAIEPTPSSGFWPVKKG